MAEDILKKLEKLDATEEALNNLEKSFEKLEGRIHTLEDAFASTKRDVEREVQHCGLSLYHD